MVEKLIPQIDKLKHFYLWTLLFFLILLIGKVFPKNLFYIVEWFSYFVVLITAMWKEIVKDWIKGKGNAEFMDFFYSVIVASLYMIIKLI